jgi:hypothetical protein
MDEQLSGPRPGWVSAHGYSGLGWIPLHHCNKWYQSQRLEKLGNTSPGHMVTGEPVNVSGWSHGWLWLESWTRGLDNVFMKPHWWLRWKSWAQCVIGKIVGFSATSEIYGREAQHIWGQSSPIRLLFWAELGPEHYCCWLLSHPEISNFRMRIGKKLKQRFSLNFKILPNIYFLYREYSIGKILCLIF